MKINFIRKRDRKTFELSFPKGFACHQGYMGFYNPKAGDFFWNGNGILGPIRLLVTEEYKDCDKDWIPNYVTATMTARNMLRRKRQ